MFKKTLSIILITTLLFTTLVIAPVTAQAQPVQTSQTAADAPTQLGADNSLGEMFSTAVNREQNDGANGITDVSVNGTKATVVLNNEEACTVIVGIYDESDDHLIATAIQRSIPANAESVTLNFSTALPQYYYLRAFILDSACCPLAKQYESSRYTQAYAEFLEKTTADFPSDRVLNLDNDTTDNFAVLDESVTKVTSSASANTPAKTSDSTYTFSNIDDTLRSLKQGDIFTFELNGNPEVVKIGAITVSGNTATITSTKAEMEEAFDYVKIDTTSEQPQTAPTGGNLAPTGFDFEGEYSVEKEFKMNDNEDACRFGITGSVTVGATAALKLHVDFTANIQEISVTFTYGGKVNIGLELKLSVSIPLGSVPVPLAVAGIVASISASLELSAEAKVEVEFPYNGVLGFSYSNTAGFTNLSHKPEFDPQFTCEGKLFAGVKLTPSVTALMLAKAEISGTAGIQAVGTRMPTVTDVKSSDHLCRWCIEGSVDLTFEAEAKLEFGLKILGFSQNLTFKLGDISKKLFDFHISANNGFGKGPCKNKRKPVEDEYTPPDFDNLPTGGSQTTTCSLSGAHDNMTLTVRTTGNGYFNRDEQQQVVDDYVYQNVDLYNDNLEEEAENLYPRYWYSGGNPNASEDQLRYIHEHAKNITKNVIYVSCPIVTEYPGGSFAGHAHESHSLSYEEHITEPCEYLGISVASIPDSVRYIYYPARFSDDYPIYSRDGLYTYNGKYIDNAFVGTNIPPALEYNNAAWVKLKSATIPESLKYSNSISFPFIETATLLSEGVHIFDGSIKLHSVTIGDNVTKLGDYVFKDCHALKSITIPPSVEEIGRSAFCGSGLERITIPGTVKKIDYAAFCDCPNLREVILEDGVQEIDALAFANCPNLDRVVIPESVAMIDRSAFNDCEDVIIDYDGTVEQWDNIVAYYFFNYNDNVGAIYKMGELPPSYLSYLDNWQIYQYCTIYCYPNEDGETSPAPTGTGLAATGASSNAISGKYTGAEYLIAVENAQNGLLNGDITALKQVTADDSGCIDISGINCPDGQYLNTYGACRHPSAHAKTVDGKTQCACDICGASVKPIITGESSAYIDIEDRLRGDADCDKNVTILDATAVQRKLAGFIPTRFHAGAADADSDGTVTILDATAIQRYLAGYDVDLYGIKKPFYVPPTEPPTDPPTDPPTEEPTEPETDPETEEPTDAPTEAPTQEPTEFVHPHGDITFDPGEAGEGDPVWYAWVWGATSSGKWIAGTDSGNGIVFPEAAEYDYIVVVKMKNGTTNPDWSDDVCLNQSVNISITGNHLTFTGWSESMSWGGNMFTAAFQ